MADFLNTPNQGPIPKNPNTEHQYMPLPFTFKHFPTLPQIIKKFQLNPLNSHPCANNPYCLLHKPVLAPKHTRNS